MFVLNGRFAVQAQTGVQRFAWQIARRWGGAALAGRIVVAVPRGGATSSLVRLGLPVIEGALEGHAWEQFELPFARGGRALVGLCNAGPVSVSRQLVVLHDVAFLAHPSNFSHRFRLWYGAMVSGYLRRGARLATVSRFSASEIAREFGVPLGKIAVTGEGGEHILDVPADREILIRHDLAPGTYVLAVSSNVKNKNFAGIAKAAELVEDRSIRFVAAGGSGQASTFAGAGVSYSNLLQVGFVTDGQLRALYENAGCFLFPSFYEGFGLPVLEAMNCGCPVIAANLASLPEICGDAAVFCDPFDPLDIAVKVRDLMRDSARRVELGGAGLVRARAYSWGSASAALWDSVERICP